MLRFEIIEKSWCKRRPPTSEPTPIKIEIPGFKPEYNHMCTMYVEYTDGSKRELISRVIVDPKDNSWIIDGMHVAVRVIE